MTQLIETSLISGHFANKTNTVYLDVFSCKYYDPRAVGEFATEFSVVNITNYKCHYSLISAKTQKNNCTTTVCFTRVVERSDNKQ